MKRILYVEDEIRIADYVCKGLQQAGFMVTWVADGELGLKTASQENFDCLILDVGLPKLSGLDICQKLRQEHNTPILMLTAQNNQTDIITGLKSGADDYLSKPFHMNELIARLESLTRRAALRLGPRFIWGEISLDSNTRRVTKGNQLIKLAPREYALLEYLFRHQGAVCKQTDLLSNVWYEPDALALSKTIDVHIAYLRKKLTHELIVTAPGHGYYIPHYAPVKSESIPVH